MNTVDAIRKEALAIGFFEVGEISVKNLRYREEIRRLCEGNLCRNYRSSWACPPAIGTLEECRKRCERYDSMLLLSGKYELNDSFDFDGMKNGMMQFKRLIEKLDDAIKGRMDDYLLLSNEGCGRCQKCTYPDAPCRFPDRLYHSIEGYGFEIAALAKASGIAYNNGENTVTYFGAILFRQAKEE